MIKVKRLISTTIIMLMILFSITNAGAQESSSLYDVDNSTLLISKHIDEPQLPFAGIIVLPANMKRTDLNEVSYDERKMLYKFTYTVGGQASEEIDLSQKFDSGEYIVYIECGSYTDKSIFIVPMNSLTEMVANANSGREINANFGADTDKFNANSSEIRSYISNAKPSAGYTDQNFIDTYLAAEGLAEYRSGKISLDEFVDLYDIYYEEVYNTFNEWESAFKNEYGSVLKDYTVSGLSPQEVVEEAMFVTDCHCAGDVYALQSTMIEYLKSINADYDSYNSLNDYNKYSVMSKLYDRVGSLHTEKEIYDNFVSICEDAAETASQHSSGGGGSSSGGSGGGGGIGISVIGGSPATNTTDDESGSDIIGANDDTTLTDIQGHWAKEYIEACQQQGLVNGFPDNTFHPDSNITRAEFTTLIVRLIALDTGTDCDFKDVSESSWYYDNIAKAYSAGLVNGYDDYFRPEENISRQDAAVIILRSLNYEKISLTERSIFEDMDSISDYAKESVAYLAGAGIITGDNNNFRPNSLLTRAEAAAIIYRTNELLSGTM